MSAEGQRESLEGSDTGLSFQAKFDLMVVFSLILFSFASLVQTHLAWRVVYNVCLFQ